MGCVPAKTCSLALAEATKRWPGRNRASDGICGDASHQTRPSDHNRGEAWDLTHDPAHGVNAHAIADWLRLEVLAGREHRIKYIISNKRIFNPSVSKNWRKYSGVNPHTKHMHVSVKSSARDSTRLWFKGFNEEELIVTPEDETKIQKIVADELKKLIGVLYVPGGTVQKALWKKQGTSFAEHLNLLEQKLDELLKR